jgi:hypothetical protein
VLDHGAVIFDGDAIEGVARYLEIGADLIREALQTNGAERNGHTSPAMGYDLTRNAPRTGNQAADPGTNGASRGAVAPQGATEVATCGVRDSPGAGKATVPCQSEGRSSQQLPDQGTPVVIDEVEVVGEHQTAPRHGERAKIRVRYRCGESLPPVRWGFAFVTADLATKICSAASSREDGVLLRPGAGELSCKIPRLPLRAGSYAMRIGIVDCRTGAPLACFGWESAPAFFTVEAEVNYDNNMYTTFGDLMAIDVDW